MIDTALVFLKDEINAYLGTKPLATANVEFTNFYSNSSGVPGVPDKKVGMGIINIEEEATTRNAPHYRKSPNGTIAVIDPEVKLNVYVLFAAHRLPGIPDTYDDALRDISNVIAFFQSHRHFDQTNSPALDSGIKKLVCDLHSVPLEQVHYMWSSLHSPYLPSVMYKMRLVCISDQQPKQAGPGIVSVTQTLKGK